MRTEKRKVIKPDRRMLGILYDGFVKCPTTGKILEVLEGDDKVLCSCGKSNPKCQAEQTERTHTHLVSFCERASVDEFITQGYAWRSKED